MGFSGRQIRSQYLPQPPGAIASNFHAQVDALCSQLRSRTVVDVTVQVEHARLQEDDGAVRED
jgi:hypothetical protein